MNTPDYYRGRAEEVRRGGSPVTRFEGLSVGATGAAAAAATLGFGEAVISAAGFGPSPISQHAPPAAIATTARTTIKIFAEPWLKA